jgi:signal transduction histidine kinase
MCRIKFILINISLLTLLFTAPLEATTNADEISCEKKWRTMDTLVRNELLKANAAKKITFDLACGRAVEQEYQAHYSSAAKTFESAAQLAPSNVQRATMLREAGLASINADNKVDGALLLHRALKIAQQSGDGVATYRTLNALAISRTSGNDWQGALTYLDQAIAHMRSHQKENPTEDMESAWAAVHYNRANYLSELGQMAQAEQALDDGTSAMLSLNQPLYKASYFKMRAVINHRLHRLDAAQNYMSQALLLLDELPPGVQRLTLLITAGHLAETRKDSTLLDSLSVRMKRELAAMKAPPDDQIAYLKTLQVSADILAGRNKAALAGYRDSIESYKLAYTKVQAADLANVEARYQKEQRETQISLLNSQNALAEATVLMQRWAIGGLVCAIGLALLISYWVFSRREQRRVLVSRLAEAQAKLDERARIAREIHDTLLQDFAANSILVQRALGKIESAPNDAKNMLEKALLSSDRSLKETRLAIHAAHLVSNNNLKGLLEDVVIRQTTRTTVSIVLDSKKLAASYTGFGVTEVARIAEEAVTNAIKHARATQISVLIKATNSQLTLIVSDNGHGFIPAAVEVGHFGIQFMRERATLLDGTIDITSATDDIGTQVTLTIPLPSVHFSATG